MQKKNKPTQRSFQRVNVVKVYIWDNYVGAVALDPAYQFYAFAFDEKFRRNGINLSPLQMPVASADQPQLFINLPEATYQRLPAFLADALPDDFGNALVDRYMAERGISRSQITVLDRLAYMGNRAMGALEFRPQHGPRGQTATAIKLGELVAQARHAIAGTIDGDEHANAALRSIIEVGTSAGGARAKAVIAWNPQTDEIRSGQAIAPTGFEHWLLKFDGMGKDHELGSSSDYGRIEYAYYLMATAAGITMNESRLLLENGRAHFMTKRFDREGTNLKHHIQTLCSMSHIDFKKKSTNGYAQFFTTISALNLGHAALVEAFRRMVFNVMARNCDDHSKNFSFRMRQGESWELAPAYDVTFAHNPAGEWTSAHLLSVNGKFQDLTINDLLCEADRFGIGEAKSVIKRVREALQTWSSFAKKAGVSQKEIEHIGRLHCLLE